MATHTVVIETPRGSAEKFAFDPEHQAFALKRVLPVGMVFPFDFGFVAGTKADDGDPVDVVVLSEFKSFPGCLVECRILGALLGQQQEKTANKEKTGNKNGKNKRARRMIRNDRLIAVPAAAHTMDHVKNIDDLPGAMLEELEQFFVNYHEQEGTKYESLERVSAARAEKLLAQHET
jgi:inorganic pyrophosphatase